MPILIDNSNFTDVFGNTTPFYICNSGDKITATFYVRSVIRMTSVGNPLTLDPQGSINQVTSPTSWIDEGFRVGDWVYVRLWSSGGGLIIQDWWTQVTYVDDVLCDFTSMPYWMNIQNQETIEMVVVDGNGSYNFVARDDIEINLNHIKNSLPTGVASLIDGETTKMMFFGIQALLVGGISPGVIVGNQSGQFLLEGEVERVANDGLGWFQHQIRLTFIQSGVYDASWFATAECLKVYFKILWARISGEPYARAEAVYNLEANTGWFDEPHNSSILDSQMTLPISELDYCVPTTTTITVDGPILSMGMGACYVSTDDDYYKNQVAGQDNLTMIIPTTIINNFFVPVSSEINNFGAGYDIQLNSFTQVGTISTMEITFTPNAQFTTFMDNVEDGDRLFYLWIKCGNLNLLAFAGQLTCAPPVAGPLVMVTDYGYLDHSQNVDTITGVRTGFDADTEDDLAYTGTFLLNKNQIYDSFSTKIEAFNTVTDEDFTLQNVTFSFLGVPFSNDGRYLLNETQTIVTTLPNTSEKRIARLELEPSLDTPTQYGVRIFYPFLCRWEYWLNLNGVSVDFYPNFDRNWEQYDNIGNWTIRTELQLVSEGLAYLHNNELIINPYDNEPAINSTIELETTVAPVQVVGIVVTGSIMLLRGIHQLANPLNSWVQPNVWGTLTVEPYESSQRWICSTIVETDGNTNNPLTPISGLFASLTFPNQYTAVIECYFNTDLIDLSNGVKFSSKIKENDTAISQINKTTSPNDIQKTDTFTIDKTLA